VPPVTGVGSAPAHVSFTVPSVTSTRVARSARVTENCVPMTSTVASSVLTVRRTPRSGVTSTNSVPSSQVTTGDRRVPPRWPWPSNTSDT
jgi:hypothetical protein